MPDAIGIDIVETDRIRRSVERFGDRFLQRILSEEELEAYALRGDRDAFVAGRFACKEAAIKALGKYLSERPPYSGIQVLNDQTGQPHMTFCGRLSGQLSGLESMVSISHERNYAVAVVILSEKS